MDWHLVKLREWCEAGGNPPLGRLKNVAKTRHELPEVAFLEKYLFTASDNVQLLLLKILCEAGKPVSECLQGYFGKHDKGEEIPGVVAAELIRLAELQNDPETISAIISMEERNRHAGILALKRMGAEECLAPLLSSRDKTLSDLVRGFMK